MANSPPPRAAHHPPGYDENDPYENVDLDTLPEWWRRNVEKFAAHEMRPYRPPRFSDGEFTPEIVHELEAELGVTIRFRNIDPHTGNDWAIWVDGNRVATVQRTREAGGFSKYHLDSDRFAELVRQAV